MRILLIMVMAALVSCGKGDTLARKGKSPYAIVLSKDASPSERHAAEELARFVALATDAELPVVAESDSRAQTPPRIFVGMGDAAAATTQNPPDVSTFGDEEFIVRTLGDSALPDILIAGGRLRGAMYGVYSFLDSLGFRWYTTSLTRYPEGKTLPVKRFDFRGAPAFMSRDSFITEFRDPDWAVRNRVNPGHAKLDASVGGNVMVNGVHTLDRLVPPTLYDEHPEYFPLIGGKRVTGLVQRCMSNPEIVDIAVKNLREWMDREPVQRIFSVSANDVGMLCQCDECRRITEEEGATAGLFLRFVNKVAEQIEELHPQNYVSTLAYAITETAPKKIMPRKNVIIRLCPFHICTGHSFTECTSPASVRFYQTLRDWDRLSDNIFIWHYATNFDAYLLPFPNFREFTRDLAVYKEHGVNGIFLQGAGAAGSCDADLRAWVAARMMWDPTLDPDTLVNEWMHAVYGAAFDPMRAVFDHIHSRVDDPDNHLHIHDPIRAESWPPEELAYLDNLYTSAEKLAANDPDALFYVRRNRMSIRYLDLLFNSGKLVLDGDKYRPTGNTATREEYEQFRRDMTDLHIEALREEPFDCIYEDLLGEKLRPHDTVTLENADIKVVVVPDLGGRIVSIVRKSDGAELMGRTDSLNYFYPAFGGYEESTTMTWGRTGFSNVYTAVLNGRTLTLTAPEGISARAKGLIFKRTMTLPEHGARIDFESTITNITDDIKYARLINHMQLAVDPADAMVGIRSKNGKTTEQPAKNLYLNTDKTPAGLWYVRDSIRGWTMENRFPAKDIEACRLITNERTGTVGMEVLGFERNLPPGGRIERKHSWEVR